MSRQSTRRELVSAALSRYARKNLSY